jgi:hypothetical protein
VTINTDSFEDAALTPVAKYPAPPKLTALFEKVGTVPAAVAFDPFPLLSPQTLTLLPELNVKVEASAPSSHNAHPGIWVGFVRPPTKFVFNPHLWARYPSICWRCEVVREVLKSMTSAIASVPELGVNWRPAIVMPALVNGVDVVVVLNILTPLTKMDTDVLDVTSS